LSAQLEPWERQLALIEIMLLSGGTPYANFKELAFAWGREKGFHHVLANSVCERRGEVERKKRADAGKVMSEEEKIAFRSKLQKTRHKNGTSKKAKKESASSEGEEEGSNYSQMVNAGGVIGAAEDSSANKKTGESDEDNGEVEARLPGSVVNRETLPVPSRALADLTAQCAEDVAPEVENTVLV